MKKIKKLLNNKNTHSRVSSNTRQSTTNFLPRRSMKTQALPLPVDPLADDKFAIETMEDLFSSPSTARLRRSGDSLCDSQGTSILRIGEQV